MQNTIEGAFMSAGTCKILVVDDDPSIRNLLSRQLERLGYEAEFTASASGFLSRLSSRDAIYDLAIIDINLPGIDGREIITWMRESDLHAIRQLPVLIISGFPERIPERFVEDYGRCRLLPKPYSHDALKDSISDYAGRPN